MIVVAEVGLVHNGSLSKALKLIDIAKEVGADAVKFQTHIAERETLINAPNPTYFKKVEDKIFVNLKRLFYLVILQVTVGIFVVISKLAFSMTAVHLLIALIIVGVILNLLFAKKEVNS